MTYCIFAYFIVFFFFLLFYCFFFLHAPDEQAVSCCEVKVGMKRKARDTQDSSHQIVGETLQTVSEGTSAKMPKLDNC